MENSVQQSANKQRSKNEAVYILRYICQAAATKLTSGAFATAFMVFIGLNTEMISVVNFWTNAGLFVASVFVIFAYNWDKSGLGIIRMGSVGNALTSIGMLVASFLYLISFNATYVVLAGVSFIGNTAYSMRNSAEINAVPMLFGRDRYARMMGKCGYIGGTITLAISVVTIFFLQSREDVGYYRTFFAISSGLMIIYALLTFFLKKPADQKKLEVARVDFRKVFTKEYLIEALPHLTRGIGSAALVLWPATIMSRINMTPLQSSLLIPMSIVAEIVGSFIFVKLSSKMKPGTMTMISFIVSAVFMFLTPVITTVPIFFISYFIYDFMLSGFGKALIASFVYSCNKEKLPLISSLHVLYYAIAYCPAVWIFGKFMDDHTVPCMLIAGIIYIISGVMWHFFFRKPAEE